MNRRRIERYAGFYIAGLVGLLMYFLAHLVPVFPKLAALGTMTFGVIVAGFAATQRTILIGLVGRRMIRLFVKSGLSNDTLVYFQQCIWSGLAFALISALRLFFDDCIQGESWIWRLFLGLWSGGLVLLFIFLARNEKLLFNIVSYAIKNSDLMDKE